MTEEIQSRQHESSQPTKCDLTLKEDDTNLLYLISEHTRLSKLDPKDYVLKSPGTYCFPDYVPVVLNLKNIVTMDGLTKSPNKILKGRFFVCRSVTPSIKLNSLLAVVQVPDPKMITRGVFLSLGNHFDSLHERKKTLLPILSPGSIIVVKNPVFFRSSSDSVYAVKSDNPADVLFLDDDKFEQLFPGLVWPCELKHDETFLFMRPRWNWWKAVKDWKAIAHMRLQKNNYIGALEAYGLALNCNPKDVKALSLRCALYLNLRAYRKCIKDAEDILELNNANEKAIHLKALSMISLGQYTEAIEYLEWQIGKCIPIIDSRRKTKFTKIIVKAKTWRDQEKFGKYDPEEMIDRPENFIHDCADYVGNVRKQNIPGKGIGMIATSEIKCGELIMGTKAFVMVYPDDPNSKPRNFRNLENNRWRSCEHLLLVALVAHRLIIDPELGEELYRLYDGNERSLSEPNGDVAKTSYVNMRKLNDICEYNCFCAESDSIQEPRGLWPLASYFNHSCYDANSDWGTSGNFLSIKANKNIMKDEEITIAYVDHSLPYLERVSILSEYGFVCRCSLCQFDEKDTDAVHSRREEILTEIRHLVANIHCQDSQIKPLIDELEDLRRDDPRVNTDIFRSLFKLAKLYLEKKEFYSAAKIFHSVHNSTFGTMFIAVSTESCCYAIVCYANCRKLEEAKNLMIDLKANLIQKYGTASNKVLKYEILQPLLYKYLPEHLAETILRSEIVD